MRGLSRAGGWAACIGLDHRPMTPGIAYGRRPVIDLTGAGIAQRRQMLVKCQPPPVSIRVRACHLLKIPGQPNLGRTEPSRGRRIGVALRHFIQPGVSPWAPRP